MNWKGFCGKIADADSAFDFHPVVPVPVESVDRQPLPFLSDLLGICKKRYRQVWRDSWKLVGDKANPALPPVASRGIRSGTLR
jgi:hypothetical protein